MCRRGTGAEWRRTAAVWAIAGFLPLREQFARKANTSADQVIVGGGSLNLLDLFIRLLVESGDWVFVKEPTCDRPLILLHQAGARIRDVLQEEDGLDTGYLAQRLKRGERPVFLYLIPDFQNPSGTVIPQEKRRHIIELARQYDFWIVQDLPYRKLRDRGDEVPMFLEAVSDRVLQMSSFSKLISPGLRVGQLIVPEPLAGPLARIAEETCINASYLHQAIVYEFVQRGWLDPQIEELKATYQPLLDATLATLEAHMGDLATWHQPDGGFSVCTTLNAPVDAGVLQQKALEAGLPILIHRSACIAPCPNTGKRSNPSFIQVRTGGRSCFPRTSPQDGGDGYTVRKGVGLLTQDEKEGMR